MNSTGRNAFADARAEGRQQRQAGSGWTPTYPDENLPFDEAESSRACAWTGRFPASRASRARRGRSQRWSMLGVAASNNWAIAPQRSRSGKSLMANDTHLPLSMPSVWNYVQIRSPKYQAAGVSIAGLPGVVAGFNGAGLGRRPWSWATTRISTWNSWATPGQPASITWPTASGSQPANARNLLHQGPATDPRGHPRNPPRPAAQQRPGRGARTSSIRCR
ncbi:penicillin acylase family protein [Pseudomonas aeruginosa]